MAKTPKADKPKGGLTRTLQVELHRDTYEGTRHAAYFFSRQIKWIVQEALDQWLTRHYRKFPDFQKAVEAAAKARRKVARERYESGQGHEEERDFE